MFSLFSPFLYPSPSLHSLRDRSKRCFENWAGISMELATKNGNRSIDRRDTPSRRRGVIRLFSSFECIERKGNTSPGCSKEAAPRFTACSTPSRLPCNFIFAFTPYFERFCSLARYDRTKFAKKKISIQLGEIKFPREEYT